VQLLSGPDSVLSEPTIASNPYLHITLACTPPAKAKDALALPARVASGGARRVALSGPIVLTGQVLGFM